MKFYTSDNVEINYTDSGNKDNPCVMILTGIGGYKEIWTITVNELVKHGYRVVNMDARNQGMSERTPKGERMSRHAMDLWELQQKLNIKKPLLMGNSMGAATMWAYVSLFTDKGIAGIVDVDQSPKMIADDSWKYGFKDLNWDNFPEYCKEPFGSATVEKIPDKLFTMIKELQVKYPYDRDLNMDLLIDHSFQDWRDILVDLKVPMLIVAAAESPFFNYQFAPLASKMAPNGQYKIVQHSGHIIMAEQPQVFNETLLNFLTQIK